MDDFWVSFPAEDGRRIQVNPKQMMKSKADLDFMVYALGAAGDRSLKMFKSPYSTFTIFSDRSTMPVEEQFWDEIFRWALEYAGADKGCSVLLQYWAPMEGMPTKLTISGQPFCVQNLSYGLCVFRRKCIEKVDDFCDTGPPGRVFRHGFPEYCPDIAYYSAEEFPTRNYAIRCRIASSLALPVFKYDEKTEYHECVGVVECISLGSFNFLNRELFVPPQQKDLFFGFTSDDMLRCSARRDVYLTQFDIGGVLKFVREAYQLPLIQVWVPCLCNDELHQNKLFCDMRICSEYLSYVSEFRNLSRTHGACYVKKREGLVGGAYAHDRPCFSRNTTQLCISDYPFIHLTRYSGLDACFVIPLKCVHPTLDSLFLEMFLPPETPENRKTTGNPEAVLESLLSTLARGFSEQNNSVGLKQNETFLAEYILLDGKKNWHFNVKRLSTESLPNDPNIQDTNDSSSKGAAQRVLLDLRQIDLNTLKPNTDALNMINTTGEIIAATLAEDQITLDVLKPYFGNNIDAAAKDLGVSRSTLKRKCRQLGIKRWPWHKKNKEKHAQLNPRLQHTLTQNNAREKEAPNSQFQTKNNAADTQATATSVPSSSNEDRIRQSHNMIGKATYGDDTVMFPLKSYSGITELRKDLNQRFQLQDERYKIKYNYKDEWILIVCDQDLHLAMEMIKSTGKNTINLSILATSS